MDTHTSLVLIILVVSVTLLGLQITLEEPFQNVQQTLSDSQCSMTNSSNKLLGWRDFWNMHYSTFDPDLEKVFTKPSINNFLKPLSYDGIYKGATTM